MFILFWFYVFWVVHTQHNVCMYFLCIDCKLTVKHVQTTNTIFIVSLLAFSTVIFMTRDLWMLKEKFVSALFVQFLVNKTYLCMYVCVNASLNVRVCAC